MSKLIEIVIENADTKKGILIENKNDHLIIQAKGETQSGKVLTMQELVVENSNEVPVSLINYVARTRSSLVLNNACKDSFYNTDNNTKKHRVKPLLCLPKVLQKKFPGIFYVENNLSTDIFTPGRIDLLKTLSSQATISIENAQLYTNLKNNILEIRHKEMALRKSEEQFKSIRSYKFQRLFRNPS